MNFRSATAKDVVVAVGTAAQWVGRVPASPGSTAPQQRRRFTAAAVALRLIDNGEIQPFSQKSRTATVPKVFQIGLYVVVEADLELFCNSWSAGFLGERL